MKKDIFAQSLILIFSFLVIVSNAQKKDTILANTKGTEIDPSNRRTLVKLNAEYQYVGFPIEPKWLNFEAKNGIDTTCKPVLFEAKLAPQFIMLGEKTKNAAYFTIVPNFTIRMYSIRSLPVRTPNFNPQLTVYWPFIKTKELLGPNTALYFTETISHYSNGQDGAFYQKVGSDSIINHYNGNFSTNYLEFGLHFLCGIEKWGWYNLNIIYQQNMSFDQELFVFEPDMIGKYGKTRMWLDQKIIAGNNHHFIIRVNVGFILDKHLESFGNTNEMARRVTSDWTLTYNPPFLNDISLFAKLYQGHDYYNIYFNRVLFMNMLGISINTNFFTNKQKLKQTAKR